MSSEHKLLDLMGQERQVGYLSFDDAFDFYLGYQTGFIPGSAMRDDKTRFRDAILHPVYGLRVHVLTNPSDEKRYVVLTPDNIDLDCFYGNLLSSNKNDKVDERLSLDQNSVSKIIRSMYTEWDRLCARVLIASNRTNSESNPLGIDCGKVSKNTQRLLKVSEDEENTFAQAKEITTAHFKERSEIIVKRMTCLEELKEKHQNRWMERRLAEISDEIEKRRDSNVSITKLLDSQTPYDIQKLQQMIKRKTKQLMDTKSLKKRALTTQGPPERIDAETEKLIAQSIEQKATYHGRRHGTTMLYTNRRVKKRDLLSITNYHLLKANKRIIKSATTAWNRSQPRNSMFTTVFTL